MFGGYAESAQDQIYITIAPLGEYPNLTGMPSAREDVLEFMREFVNLKLPNVGLRVVSRLETDIRSVLEPLTAPKISLHDEIGQKKDKVEYINSIACSGLEHAEVERGREVTCRYAF